MRAEEDETAPPGGLGVGSSSGGSRSGLCLAAWGLHPAPLPGVPKGIRGEWDPHQEDRMQTEKQNKEEATHSFS